MLATLAIINMAVASVLITQEVQDIDATVAQEPTAIVATVNTTETVTAE